MKTNRPGFTSLLVLLGLVAWSTAVHAQTAYWTNNAPDDWNNAANWNIDLSGFNAVPGTGTNVDIGSQAVGTVDYNSPMTAPSVGAITLSGGSTLNVNAAGFNVNPGDGATSPITLSGATMNVNAGGGVVATNGGSLTVNSAGILNVAGNIFVENAAAGAPLAIAAGGLVSVNPGGALSATGGVTTATGAGVRLVLTGGSADFQGGGLSFLTAGAGSISGGSLAVGPLRLGGSGSGNTGFLTNNGGTLTASSTTVNPNNVNINCLLVIGGGTNDLGLTTVNRSSSGSASFNALGTEGLVISNGIVRMSGLNVGYPDGNSALSTLIAGGTVTNDGPLQINNKTSGRGCRFLQMGGLFVTTDPNLVHIGITNAGQVNIFSVTGGTNMAGGFVLGEITNTSGTINFTNASRIYVGSGGISSTSIQNLNVVVNAGGFFGANADWTASVPMFLNGGGFDTADPAGTARDITVSGPLRGSGLVKTGAGRLILNATNIYSGVTLIQQGRLVIGATGSISNTAQINVGADGIFDVSATGFGLNAGQTLVGSGTIAGNLTAQSGSGISPGASVGTLTFLNNLTLAGGVSSFELSAATNDQVVVTGTLDVSAGGNAIVLSALSGAIPAGTYTLFRYGTLNGGLGDFTVSGAPGVLTNDTSSQTISFITPGVRASTSVVWVGGPAVNDLWDTVNSTNWLNGGVPDYFVSGDDVRFDDTGAANPVVTVVAPAVLPASITVDATANYTYTGSGSISGSGTALTKTNSGTLTVLTTNGYTGPTILGGGWLEAAVIANSGSASSIGAASSDPTNLVFNGGALRYLGATATSDHGATLNSAAEVDVTNSAATLTLGGVWSGTGPIVKTGPGSVTLSGNNSPGGIVISNGAVRVNSLASAGTNGIAVYGSTFRLGTTATLPNEMRFEGVCTLDLLNTGGNQALDGAWSGDGTVNIINQQSTTIRTFTMGGNGFGGGSMTNFTGTVNIGTNNGFFRFNDGGGTFNAGNSNMLLDLGTSTAIFLNRNRGVVIYLGALAGGSGTLLTNGTDSSGTTTYVIGDRNADSTFAGVIGSASGAPIALFKEGTGTLTLGGSNTYNGATTISNGVLAVTGIGAIGGSPTIHLVPGAFLDSSTRVDGTFTLGSGQTLDGGGVVRGSLAVASNAVVSPGDGNGVFDTGISKLTITNAFVLQSGGALNLDIDPSTPTNDMIQAGSITYGGTLNLNISSTLALGDSIKLFDAATYGGAFDAISPANPNFDPSLVWDTSRLYQDGTLVVGKAHPLVSTVYRSGTDLIFGGTNGVPFQPYYVLTSTNMALPLSQWTSTVTNTFDFDGSFSVTNAIAPDEPQRFYLLQLP